MFKQHNLRAIFETVPEPVLVADPDTFRIRYANPAAQVTTGYTASEFSQRTLPEVITASEPHAWDQLASDGATHLLGSLLCSDKVPVPTEIRIVYSTIDHIPCLVCIVEQAATAPPFSSSNGAESQDLLNALPIAATLIDAASWRVLAVNQTGTQLWGQPADEILGTLAFDLPIPPQRSLAEHVVQTGQEIQYQDRINGQYVDVALYPLFDSQQRVTRLASLIRNITEQKKAEDDILRQTRLLRGVAEATNRLLASGEYAVAIQEALAILGAHVNADRIFIFEGHPHPDTGEPAISERFEWIRDQIEPDMLHNIPWQQVDAMHVYDNLVCGKPVAIAVAALPPASQAAMVSEDIRNLLMVPIFIKGQFWGVIGLADSLTERHWSHSEINALQTMAASVGASIERHQVEAELRHKRDISETMLAIGNALTSSLELDDVLKNILQQVRHVIQFDTANVMLIEDSAVRIVQGMNYEAFGVPPGFVGHARFEIESVPNIQAIIESGEPYLCANVYADPTWVTHAETHWIRSWLGAPIISQGEVVGLFSLDSATPGFYGSKHVDLIAPYSQQAAIAFENAQLYQKTQTQAAELNARLQQLDALYHAGQAILSTLDLDQILRRFARQMTHIADATSTLIFDFDPLQHVAEVQATYARTDIPVPEVIRPVGEQVILDFPAVQSRLAARHGILLERNELVAMQVDITCLQHIQTAIVVPLFSKERLSGLAIIRDSRPDRRHTPDDVTTCEALATLAAVAIEQATLFADIQALEQVKSEMLRMASHDLRNPLTRIQGLIEMLEDSLERVATPMQQEYFRRMWEAVTQMDEIITDILTLERIDAQRRGGQPIDWTHLVRHVTTALQDSLGAMAHTLGVECTPDLPPVWGNSTQLQQAMTNLLSNAIKYTPPGGYIVVRTFMEGTPDGKACIVFEVQDNGIGIPQAQQDGLFQPFFRAQHNDTPHIPGTGLGLSVVKTVIENHQGEVYFTSQPGEGSTFGFRLPLSKTPSRS
ncbi:MAG: GAF domain-containing protein [Chloroflexi bacterium]|nr:GAF domain-containing protein [Chloroflexota bacterium]